MKLQHFFLILFFSLLALTNCDEPERVDPPVVVIPGQEDPEPEPEPDQMEPEEDPEPEPEPEVLCNMTKVIFNGRDIDFEPSLIIDDVVYDGFNFGYNNGVDNSDGYYYVALYQLGDVNDLADDAVDRYTYDSAMRLTIFEYQRPGQNKFIVTYTYDNDRLVEILVRVFSYDQENGFVEVISDKEYVITDDFGNVIGLLDEADSPAPFVTYTYDTSIKNPYYRTATTSNSERGDVIPFMVVLNPNMLIQISNPNRVQYQAEYEANGQGYPISGLIKILNSQMTEIPIQFEYDCLF